MLLTNKEVKNVIKDVVISISATLDVDIMVIDRNKNIVGGTVEKENDFFVSCVFDYIEDQKELIVINDPGENDLCKNCKHYQNCKELIEINAPIILENMFLGIISITTYNKKSHDNIVNKLDDYSLFLMHMCGLISSKVEEVRYKEKLNLMTKQLKTIISSIEEGVLLINKNNKISYCNKVMEQIMADKFENIVGTTCNKWFKDFVSEEWSKKEKTEAIITNAYGIDNKVFVTLKNIEDKHKNISRIILINTETEVKKMVESFIGLNKQIINFDDIKGKSNVILSTKKKALKASQSNSTVLLRGESGTGKELFARAIHYHSKRSNCPFIAINCGAIPDALLESELFGYEGGAFTGASKNGRIGKFELADKGTIFLDEIGDMPIYLQVKLLRVLQNRVIQRVGSNKEIPVDIRIIAATNKPLEEYINDNRFREDLFYRLNVIPIFIPALRERAVDIEIMWKYFIKKYNSIMNKNVISATENVQKIFNKYDWPGNIRELENVMEYALNMENTQYIMADSLPDYMKKNIKEAKIKRHSGTLKELVANFEKEILIEKLNICSDKQKLANYLGIGIATLYRKLKEYEID